MNPLTRRSFIVQGAAAFAGATLLTPYLLRGENPVTIPGPIGFQSWIVRESIEKDFPGTLKKMAGLGYNSIEMFASRICQDGIWTVEKTKSS